MAQTHGTQEQDADQVGAALKRSGRTLAVAESLTGGLLASVFARASGSSEWFRGGVVAYSSAVKHDLLDVPEGPVVSAAAARAMASGAGRLLGADVAVAVTGVGGPGQQDGEPPGTVMDRHLAGPAGRGRPAPPVRVSGKHLRAGMRAGGPAAAGTTRGEPRPRSARPAAALSSPG